jgi:hypothetical protein
MNDSDEVTRARLEVTTIRDRDLDREILREWQAVDNEAPKLLDVLVFCWSAKSE